MLPQQVGFACAVLALVCCASSLFGSLGRCGEGCSPLERGLSWDSSSFFSVRWSPGFSLPVRRVVLTLEC